MRSTVHVFNRTLGQRYRLKPTSELNAGILAIFIKLQRRYKMRVCAYAFMTNHFHLVLRIQHTEQLSAFMRDLQSAIALLSYELFEGPRLFWERRYRSQELCTAAAVRQKVRYVTAHGTKEGIVPSPTEWAGLTCSRQMKDPDLAPRVAVMDPKTSVERVHVLRLSRVPEDDGLAYPKWLRQQAELVVGIEEEYAMGPFLGMARALAIPALWGPPQLRRSERARLVDWDCRDESGETDEAVLEEAKAHYWEMLERRAVAVDGTVRHSINDIEYPADCTFPHLIPYDLRARLVGCATAGRPPVVRSVPGTVSDPPSGDAGPRIGGPASPEGPPRPPD